jgi:ribonucleoside-diphosphate reductase beta chain
MKYLVYTNNTKCPYCLKAKELLNKRNSNFEYLVIGTKALKLAFPSIATVPHILSIDEEGNTTEIGGYDDLVTHFSTEKRTVFNEHNKGHLTGDYPLFFGSDLGFVDTINTPYPILDELFQQQVSQIWNELEIDLTQDRQDMLTVPASKVEPMVLNLLWQTLVDSIANRSITSLLLEYVSNSDLEAWYNAVALFETIHARTYSHIIKQTFVDPNEALKQGYENKHVINRAKTIIKAFNDVAALPKDAPEKEKKDAVYLAVIALLLLEKIPFMSSFAVTFGIAETGVFQGISQDVTLICRDEILHALGGEEVMKIQMKVDPHLATMTSKIQELFDSIIREEKEWNAYLFSEGRAYVGGNENLLNSYVDWLAKPVAALLGLKPVDAPETIPLPYMNDYTNSSRTQVAAQEMQLTSYLVNSISASTDEEITKLLNSYK